MATIEELKEIIVKLNVSVLHLNETAEALQKENEHLRESVDALSAPSQMPAPKPKCLENSEIDYIIERALGLHLPPDQSLALSRDEVFKIEEEFQRAEQYMRCLELENDTLRKAIGEQENETVKYQRLYNNEHNRALCLEGELEECIKESDELRNKIAALEREVTNYHNIIGGVKE